jgi:hypothetical protein
MPQAATRESRTAVILGRRLARHHKQKNITDFIDEEFHANRSAPRSTCNATYSARPSSQTNIPAVPEESLCGWPRRDKLR